MPFLGKREHSPIGSTSTSGRNNLVNNNDRHMANDRTTARRSNGIPFSFGTWIKLHGVDIITMAIFGAIGLGVYYAGPAPRRSFPVYFQDGTVVYPDIAYPLRKNIIPIWLAAFLAFITPVVFITLFQIRRRSIDDWLTTVLGVLKSLITAAVFQVFIKWLIGGLRPHFLAVCQPDIPQGTVSGSGFASLMYDRTICRGDQKQIDDALESMPSGHSTAAWAGLFFLALYINAQLKVMSAHNPAYWKMILFFAPLLGACLISGSLTIDEYHHWYDVLAGAIIGISTAIVAFRQTFASVTDFRFNHLLLPRSTSLFHRQPYLPHTGRGPFFSYQPTEEYASYDLPVSREGGWGFGGGEQLAGAPGDAAAFNSGMGGGFSGGHGGYGANRTSMGYNGSGLNHGKNDASYAEKGLNGHHNGTTGTHNGTGVTGTHTGTGLTGTHHGAGIGGTHHGAGIGGTHTGGGLTGHNNPVDPALGAGGRHNVV